MSLNNQDIQRLIEAGNDDYLAELFTIVRTSINDWPASVLTLEEYVDQIEKAIKGVATKQSLEQFLERCDFQEKAWQAESITGLLELYNHYDEHISLRAIAIDLENRTKTGK